jgi:hypothetical protein
MEIALTELNLPSVVIGIRGPRLAMPLGGSWIGTSGHALSRTNALTQDCRV